jgi:chemotaxis protein MotB
MTPLRGLAGPGRQDIREQSPYRDRWMVSYMDLVTILLILFMTVAARTLQDRQVAADPAGASSIQAKPGAIPPGAHAGQPPVGPTEPYDALSRARDLLQRDSIAVQVEARSLVVTLPQTVLFASGEDRINPAALPMIAQVASVLRDLSNKVLLVGHADAVPIHNRHFKNNWELSAARSMRLLEVLTGRYGIPGARLAVAGFGSYSPAVSNETEAGRAGNRRAEIVILRDSADGVHPYSHAQRGASSRGLSPGP